MSEELRGKVALVTGAARGIGARIAAAGANQCQHSQRGNPLRGGQRVVVDEVGGGPRGGACAM